MNRSHVTKDAELLSSRSSPDSHIDKVPGIVEFHLLKGPEAEDHTLYASHTVWESRACVRDMDQICGISRRAQ